MIALLCLAVGILFSVAGIVGVCRFPDLYSRLHVAGKVGVFGAAFFFLAAALAIPGGFGRGLLGAALLWLAGPVASHAIALAARRLGIEPRRDLPKEKDQPS
jgi:multicomponent Na+:H+ antiporter subunit G